MGRIEAYRPSGKLGPGAIPMGLGAGLVAAVGAGWIYQRIVDWVPFIYLNAIATIVYGLVIGLAATFGLQMGKNRNPMLACIVVVFCSAVGIASTFHYSYNNVTAEIHDDLATDMEDAAPTLEEMRAEISFKEYIDVRVEGGWEVFRSELSGPLVWLVWLLEAGIVVGTGIALARAGAKMPFCEACVAWPDEIAIGVAAGVDARALRAAAKKDLDGVLTPTVREDGGRIDAEYKAHACSGCDARFLTVELKWEATDKKGKPEEKTETILEHAIVTPEQVAKVQAAISGVSAESAGSEEEAPGSRPPDTT